MYEAMPAEDFKEFFLKYLTYKLGDNVEITDFKNPMAYAMFMGEKVNIDKNEEKWERRAAVNRENGKNGGRPRKEEKADEFQFGNPIEVVEYLKG